MIIFFWGVDLIITVIMIVIELICKKHPLKQRIEISLKNRFK